MPSGANEPMWTDVLAAVGGLITGVISLIALGVAIYAASKARSQAVGTMQQAASAHEQLELAEKVRREQLEPHIVVDILPSPHVSSVLILVIENIGSTVARNVRIAFDKPIERAVEDNPNQHKLSEHRIFTEGIPHMPPRRRIELLFDYGPDRFEHALPMAYTVSVDAEWAGGRIDTLTYLIDLSVYYNVNYLRVKNLHDGVEMLGEVKKQLELMNRHAAQHASSLTLADPTLRLGELCRAIPSCLAAAFKRRASAGRNAINRM
ncbi:hypothetical protein ACWEJ6_31120 [Nonomuraea sp. NPDC004702]